MMPFFCIYIAQGSVATCLKCGGIFKHEFVANSLPSRLVKKFWNSDNSGVMAKSLVFCFFDSRCSSWSEGVYNDHFSVWSRAVFFEYRGKDTIKYFLPSPYQKSIYLLISIRYLADFCNHKYFWLCLFYLKYSQFILSLDLTFIIKYSFTVKNISYM